MGSKRKLCFHALFAAGMFIATPAWAQNGTITGVVTSTADQRPVVTAVVEAIAADGRTAASATSDAAGRFRMTVPAGIYDVTATAIGYKVGRIERVSVSAGGSATADLAVDIAPFQLESVVVTGTGSVDPKRASETPASVSVVSERDIREQPAVTLVDHIRSAPAVDVIESGVQSRNVVGGGPVV
jgi:hypothetical protein